MGHGGQTPEGHGESVAEAGAETIDEAADQKHSRGVGDLKIGDEMTVLDVIPAEIVLQSGFEDAEELAIHVIFCDTEEEECADDPAEVADVDCGGRARHAASLRRRKVRGGC